MFTRKIGKRFPQRNRTIGAKGRSSYPNNPPTKKLPIVSSYLSLRTKPCFLCSKVDFLTKLYKLSLPDRLGTPHRNLVSWVFTYDLQYQNARCIKAWRLSLAHFLAHILCHSQKDWKNRVSAPTDPYPG